MENLPQNRAIPIFITVFVAFILIAGACSAGIVVGRLLPNPAESILALAPETAPQQVTGSVQTQLPPPEEPRPVCPFLAGLAAVHDQYVDQPVDDQTLMRGAIDGMLGSLGDPNTSYIDPESYHMLTTAIKGEDTYEGIGAWVDISEDYLTIISPMPGSPAEKAGLRTGDKIIAIDGEDMTGVDAGRQEASDRGTSVLSPYSGPGATADAAPISPSPASSRAEDDIAYVHIPSSPMTPEPAGDALKICCRNPRTRPAGNGGGLLNTAVEVGSEFLTALSPLGIWGWHAPF
jgi:carboxyl-terminal processing protease